MGKKEKKSKRDKKKNKRKKLKGKLEIPNTLFGKQT